MPDIRLCVLARTRDGKSSAVCVVSLIPHICLGFYSSQFDLFFRYSNFKITKHNNIMSLS